MENELPDYCGGAGSEPVDGAPVVAYAGREEAVAYYEGANIVFHQLVEEWAPDRIIVDVSDLCANPPEPPEEITPLDFVLGVSPLWRFIIQDKIRAAAIFQAYTTWCQCSGTAPTIGELCSGLLEYGPLSNNFGGAAHLIGPIFENTDPSGTSGNMRHGQFSTTNSRLAPYGFPTGADAAANTNGLGQLATPVASTGGALVPWSTGTVAPFVRYGMTINSGGDGPYTGNYNVCLDDASSGGEDPAPPVVPEPEFDDEGLPDPPSCEEEPDLCEIERRIDHVSDQVWRLTQLIQQIGQSSGTAPTNPTPIVDPVTESGPVDAEGIRAAVVTYAVPSTQGQIVGMPPIDLLVGYVTIETERGFLPPIRLEHSPQVIDPLPLDSVTLHLSLSPGVTASVETYQRE